MPEESPSEAVDRPGPPAATVPKEDTGQAHRTTESYTTPAEGLSESIRIERLGFLWLFAIAAVWLVRLLLDPTMVRRPLLEPNLTTGGLIFIGVSLFVFLMANVWTSQRFECRAPTGRSRSRWRSDGAGEAGPAIDGGVRRGPGYASAELWSPAFPRCRWSRRG